MNIITILLLILLGPMLVGAVFMFGWIFIYFFIITPYTIMYNAIRYGFKSDKFKAALADL